MRTELHSRDTDEVIAATRTWLAGLDKADPDYWHNRLEGLWMFQAHDVVDAGRCSKSCCVAPNRVPGPPPRECLCYWRDRVDDPLGLLKVQAGDEHPRVRLEAVRAASFFRGADVPAAQEVAVESLLSPSDDYLKYTLDETMKTLDRRAGSEPK